MSHARNSSSQKSSPIVAVIEGGQASSKTNAQYTAMLEKLQDIPTLPTIAMKVNELINDPKSSSGDIADVLKKDQVLTAKILKLANSSYYAIPGGVKDVQRALAFLGFNTVAQLILGLSIFSLFSDSESEDFSMIAFWKHALATGVCSEIIAKRLKFAKPEEAFTCGLLHDIGKLVLHEIDRKRLYQIVQKTQSEKRSFSDVEKEWELPGHPFLGEVIAQRWGLPQVIGLAVRYHHLDVSQMSTILSSAKPVIQVVRLANQICVKNQLGKSGDCSDGKITTDMLTPLGLKEADVVSIEEQLKKDMERAGAFLSVYQ